jgi:predicted O-linked N-acetylglucosamine transferase (SPINDLY family)
MSNVKVLYTRGISAFEAGDIELANEFLSQAIGTGRAAPEVYADLGVINRELGNLEIARDLLKLAIDKLSNNADFYYNIALIYGDLGELVLSEYNYQMAITIKPDMPAAYNNLGNLKKHNKDFDQALFCYEKAISADKNYIVAYKNLADLYEMSGDHIAAKKAYRNAIYLQPDAGLRIREALVLPVITESKDQIFECRDQLVAKLDNLLDDDIKIEDPVREVGATNFLLPYHGLNDKEIQIKISEMYLKACPSLKYEAPHTRHWMAGLEGGVPRVGFVSSFFHAHTIAMLNKNLIDGLPKARFDVFIFSFSEVNDAYSQDFQAGKQKYVPLTKNIDEARRQIAGAELDILYFTDIGMEPLTYFLGFSRLAPIQCVTWGHPVTTGLPNIDYFISSVLTEPENAADAYSEKLLNFEAFTACVSKPDEFNEVVKIGDVNKQNIVCPQSLFKFHPDFDGIIGGILRALPNANIQIIDGSYKFWGALIKERMLKSLSDVSDRIEIIPRLSIDGIAELMGAADVILDTPHFSGGMTTYQALATGTPVVTLPGEFMRGRLSLGIYKQMGMLECVAKDTEHYIEITKRLCSEFLYSKMIRQKIKEGHGKIFDNRTPINHHAKFFEKIMFEY